MDSGGFTLLQSYLSNRQQVVAIKEHNSSSQEVRAGVPQGSLLGPILINIYMNDIVEITDIAHFIIYADDTSIFFQSCDTTQLLHLANITLQKLHKWTKANSLKINTKKTKAVLFSPAQRSVDRNLSLYIGSEKICIVSEIKTLGIVFNEHLKWDAHVDHVCTNLSRACGVLCRLRPVVTSNIKLILYHAIFTAHINYCSLVWLTSSAKNINKLHLFQKKAIRHIATVPYDSHTNELFLQYNLLPVQCIYNFNLLTKYKNSLQHNGAAYLSLCSLRKPLDVPYEIRGRSTWFVPFSRTN